MLGGNLRPRPRSSSHNPSAPMHARVLSKDEELGKRDDDFRPKRSPMATGLLQPWRWRKRRIFTVLAVICLVYLFVRNIPTDLGSIDERMGRAPKPGHAIEIQQEPSGAPPRPNVGRSDDKHYFDGPIKFYRLAVTLHGIARTMGAKPVNRNVLFAVSSLQSAANLMPMACEMAKWDRNYAHMAFLGRDPLPLEEILEVNGVSKEDCGVYFHDGRGDFSEWSTDRRAEVAVAGAMKHIHDFMHPQVIIMDDSAVEDKFFTRAMRGKSAETGRALIEVPAGRYEEFLWMTRLDSGSLSNWFKPNIDVLIHVPEDTSGGLIRLVKSLESAEYTGLKIPRLIVELPTDIQPFAKRYLQTLQWPPATDPSPIKLSTLTLRHRIPMARQSSEEASVRMVESVYPSDTKNGHVLVLSPQAELSPLFMQYLHYNILEYKYSSFDSPGSDGLLGFSLDVPTTHLSGSDDLRTPVIPDMHTTKYLDETKHDQAGKSPFLYQAPSTTASLIFGDKWATLHDFLAHRLTASHLGKAEKTKKLISETEPAWLEYLLELMRVRGWTMLHPAVPFVTIHNELAQVPEEFMRAEGESQKGAEVLKQTDHPEEEPFLTAADPPVIVEHVERNLINESPLHEILPFGGDLPELLHLPHMSHTGDLINATVAEVMRNQYLTTFRRRIGGCSEEVAGRNRVVREMKTDDLFCLPGLEVEYVGDVAFEGEQKAHSVMAPTGGDGTTAAEDEDGEDGEDEIAVVQSARAVTTASASARAQAVGTASVARVASPA